MQDKSIFRPDNDGNIVKVNRAWKRKAKSRSDLEGLPKKHYTKRKRKTNAKRNKASKKSY